MYYFDNSKGDEELLSEDSEIDIPEICYNEGMKMKLTFHSIYSNIIGDYESFVCFKDHTINELYILNPSRFFDDIMIFAGKIGAKETKLLTLTYKYQELSMRESD